jgi:NDP-sugar pyrophosphorylase family protein
MKPVTVVILCGGEGLRLRPLTKEIPKPLVEVNNRPILSYIVDNLISSGFNDIIFATGYLSSKIENYINLKKIPTSINYSIIDSGNIDIVSRLYICSREIAGDMIVLYGDTITDIDFKKMINFHRNTSTPATVSVYQLKSNFGLFDVSDSNRVVKYEEKPHLDKWINIGYFYFDKEILKYLNEYKSFELYLNFLMRSNLISAFIHKGIHITVNTMGELTEASNNIHKIKKNYEK